MELGCIVVLRNGRQSGPYGLDQGEHTIGSSKESNIRLKFNDPLLLETHAIIRVNENGVATIVNKSVGAPVRVNGKVIFKSTILKHEDHFQLLHKEFQYFNEKLKNVPEDSEVFAQEIKNVLARSRKSVMPLSKTPAKSLTYKTKSNLGKTPTLRLSNRSFRTPVTKSLNKSTKTPLNKSFTRTYSNTSVKKSNVAGVRQPFTPSAKVVGGLAKSVLRRTLPNTSSRASGSLVQFEGRPLLNKETTENIKLRPPPSRSSKISENDSMRVNKSSLEEERNTSDVEPKNLKLNDKPLLTLSTIKNSPQNTPEKSALRHTSKKLFTVSNSLDRKSPPDIEAAAHIKVSPPLQHPKIFANDFVTENLKNSLNASTCSTRKYSAQRAVIVNANSSSLSESDAANINGVKNKSERYTSNRNSFRPNTDVEDLTNSSFAESDTPYIDVENKSAKNRSAQNSSRQGTAVMDVNNSSLSESDIADIVDIENRSAKTLEKSLNESTRSARNYSRRSTAVMGANSSSLSETDIADLDTENKAARNTSSRNSSRLSTAIIVGASNSSHSESENKNSASKDLENSFNMFALPARNYSRKSSAVIDANNSTLSESDIANTDGIENKPARNTSTRNSSRLSSALIRASNLSLPKNDNRDITSNTLENSLDTSTRSARSYSRRVTAIIDANNSTLSESDIANIDDFENKPARNASVRNYSRRSTAVLDLNHSSLSETMDTDDVESKSGNNTPQGARITMSSTNEDSTLCSKPGSSSKSSKNPRISRRSSKTTYSNSRELDISVKGIVICNDESVTKKVSFLADGEDEVIVVNALDKSRSSGRRSVKLQTNCKEDSVKNSSSYSANSKYVTDSAQPAESSRRGSRVKSLVQDNATDEENSSSQISLRLSSSSFESNKPSTPQTRSLSEDQIPATQAIGESEAVHGEHEYLVSDSSCNVSATSEQSVSPKKMTKNVSTASVDSDIQGHSMKSANSSRRLSRKKGRSSVFDEVNYISGLSKGNSIITLHSNSASSLDESERGVDVHTKQAASEGYDMRKSLQSISRRSLKMEQSSYSSYTAPDCPSQTSTFRNSRENTTASHLNDGKRSSASRNKSTKRISGTFDESTQDNDINAFKNKSRQRKSTFEETTKETLLDASNSSDDTEQVLSPVKPLSRKSMQYSRNTSASVTSRKSSIRKTLHNQVSGNSSLTGTLEQSTGSVYSISSQSFSSFKKVQSPAHNTQDDTEIDVVSYTPDTRKSIRLSAEVAETPAPKERLTSLSYTTAQMFDDVSCTSTPFHKPHLNKKSHEFDETVGDKSGTEKGKINSKTGNSFGQSEVVLSSSSNVTLKDTKLEKSQSATSGVVDIPKRRSIRSSISRNGKHNCISCRFSSVKRSRSLSASREVSATNKKLHNISPAKTVSPVKRQSSVLASNAGTPILHRKSDIVSVCENTPEKSSSTEDETPKSHIKPTRRSSKANQSAYNPVLEDITPVTPERLEVTGLTEEAFKTPINTPGLFENIRKSVIRSKKRHRESDGSTIKSNKKARVDFSHQEEKYEAPVKETVLPHRLQKSPLNRLSNFEGVKRLMKTPPKSPKNDLSNLPNLRRIMSPRPQKSPKNDLTAPVGLKRLLRSPKKQNQPANDLSDVSGVANMFNVSGVDVLHQGSDIENSEDLFTKLTGKRPIRAYPRGKSLSPNKEDFQKHYGGSRKTMGDLPICSPRVQQWVEEHATYDAENKDQPSFVNHDEDIFVNMSENPEYKARAGGSVPPKKTALKRLDRRSQGDILWGAANADEWKAHKDTFGNVGRKSGANHSESLTDKEHTQRSKIGRSVSPKKSFSLESHSNVDPPTSRHSTTVSSIHVVGDDVNMSQANDDASTAPNISPKKGQNKSYSNLAVEKAGSNQPQNESQRGRRGSLRNGIQTETRRDETLQNTSKVSSDSSLFKNTSNVSSDSSLLRNISKEPRRKSRSARSTSPTIARRTDMRRRKTQGDLLQVSSGVTNWNKSTRSSKKEGNEGISQRQIPSDTFRAIPNVDHSSQNTLEVATEDGATFDRSSRKFRTNRSGSPRKNTIKCEPRTSQNYSPVVDKQQLLNENNKDLDVSLKRKYEIGRSVSPISAVGNTSHKDDLLTPNEILKLDQIKTRNSSTLYVSGTNTEGSTPNQTLRNPLTKIEPITPQEKSSFLKTSTSGSVRAKKSAESLTPGQQIKQINVQLFATDVADTGADPSHLGTAVQFEKEMENNSEGSLTKEVSKRGVTAEIITENKPLEALRRGARRRRLLSVADVNVVTDTTGSPSVKSPIKTAILDKHETEQVTVEKADPSPTVLWKKISAKKGKAEPKGEQTNRSKKTNRGKANKDVPTLEITGELEAREEAPAKSRSKVSENDAEIKKQQKERLSSVEVKPGSDVTDDIVVKTISRANRNGRAKQADIEETKMSVRHADGKNLEEECLETPEVTGETVDAYKATRVRSRRNNNIGEMANTPLFVPVALRDVDEPLVKGRWGQMIAESKQAASSPVRSRSQRVIKHHDDLHIVDKVETTVNETETLDPDIEITSKTRSGRGATASSPAGRGGRRGKGRQDELPGEATVETTDTNEVLPNVQIAAKTRGRRGQILTDSQTAPSSPARRAGRRGKKLAEEYVEATDNLTPENLDTDEVACEVEISSKTRGGTSQPSGESKQTPLSASRKEGRRGKKNQEELLIGETVNDINKEHEIENLDASGVSHKVEIPSKTRGRKGQKAINSKQTPSSPVKRLGRRGKGHVDENAEATNNELTAKLNTDDVSHDVEIFSKTRRREKLAPDSKPVPSSPIRKVGRRAKKNQDELPIEDQMEATDNETTENLNLADTVISSNTRSRKGHLATDSKPTPSPAKRGGQRGKGFVEKNMEAPDNQGTEKLPINEVSYNVEIPSKMRDKKGKLVAGSKQTAPPSFPLRKGGQRGKENQDELLVEEKGVTTYENEVESVVPKSRSRRGRRLSGGEVDDIPPSDNVTSPLSKIGGRSTKKDEGKRTTRSRKAKTTSEKSIEVAQPSKEDGPKTTRGRGRKNAKQLEVEADANKATNSRSKKDAELSKKKDHLEDSAESDFDEDIEFNAPVRGRPKIINRKSKHVKKAAAITRKTRRGAAVATDTNLAEMAEEAPERTTRGKSKKLPVEEIIAKPKNKVIEDVIEMDVDSPRTARIKRGINKKYSTDEYEVPATGERSKRKVQFEVNNEVDGTPEVMAKRTRRARK